jgi:hypothetical protein
MAWETRLERPSRVSRLPNRAYAVRLVRDHDHNQRQLVAIRLLHMSASVRCRDSLRLIRAYPCLASSMVADPALL